MKDIDKCRGCLIGGACGDALGYVVEFLNEETILNRYGKKGISEYKLKNGVAHISDDTQMTLFTANGLLIANTRENLRGIMGPYNGYIASCYKDWYLTQSEEYPIENVEGCVSWLVNVKELFFRRSPGISCLTAIESGKVGTMNEPINQSKGCGGIMRVAPIGLFFKDNEKTLDEIAMIGAEVSAITHGHELGYIPAAGLVYLVHVLSHNENKKMVDAVYEMKEALNRLFNDKKHLSEQIELIDKAIDLSKRDIEDVKAIRELGEGWVAEETLAIAIYCALKYENDFEKAIIAAVNHNGDSDSTGAVTGNILGAHLGLKGIPNKFKENLELKNVILDIADDLFNGCKMSEYSNYEDNIWKEKYIKATYKPK